MNKATMEIDAGTNPDDILPFVKLVCLDIHRKRLGDALISGYLVMQMVALVNTPRPGIDFLAILDVIERIEKDPLQAKRRVSAFQQQAELSGLYKAHFFDSEFMIQNIKAGLNQKDGTRKKVLMEKHNLTEGQLPTPEQIGGFTQDLISGTLDERSKSDKGLTGEWIVMDKVGGRYRYLCIATHNLARKQPNLLLEEAEKGRASTSDFQKMYHWSMKQSQAKNS